MITDMAKKKKETINKDEILREARKRLQRAYDADKENRGLAMDDLKFLRGRQEDHWTPDALAAREGRPCLTINKVAAHHDQVVGDQRQNRMSVQVKPVDNQADPETAKILAGLIRQIDATSHGQDALNTAFDGASASGYGAFRVLTEYASDDVFEQDIRIRRMTNPFAAHWDPSAKEIDKSDTKWCFILEDVYREDFETLFPNKHPLDFESAKDDLMLWADSETVRIAEYFRKVPEKKTIYLLDDGRTVEKPAEGERIVKQREVDGWRIEWYKITGDDILEGPVNLPGRWIPVIPVIGKEIFIGPKREVRGLIRNAKDPQRMYNYSRSAGTELVALSPKAPYILTPRQVEGHESQWKQAHQKNFPYLLYNPDPNARNKPYREQPVQISSAIVNEIGLANEEIKDTTGIQDASLGKMSNERSGRAVAERRRSSNIATFVFTDNLARAVEHLGRILIDLIPHYYDTARVVRVLGEDGKEQAVPINQEFTGPDGKQRIHDLTVGKYDVVTNIGPGYATQRMEAVDSMIAFVQAVPAAGALIMDLVAEYSDWPGAVPIAERLKKLLPPQLQETEEINDPTGAPGTLPTGSPVLPGPGAMPPGMGEPPPSPGAAPPPEEAPLEKLQVLQEAEKLKGLQLDNRLKEAKINAEKENIKKTVRELVEELMNQEDGGARK